MRTHIFFYKKISDDKCTIFKREIIECIIIFLDKIPNFNLMFNVCYS